MCGIAGAFDFSQGRIEAGLLSDMATVQAHRGPDGEGAVVFDAAGACRRVPRVADIRNVESDFIIAGGLVHRRLAIIDLTEGGAQPMADARQDIWVTFNGEIYNYLELRAELRQRGHVFRSESDTEVLVEAYLEWGTECVAHFNGMFAFAIWDKRLQSVFCARDHLGIKPFYYIHENDRFAFASEAKALLGMLAERRANVAAVADYLMFSFVTGTDTMFAGVKRLAPGTWLLASRRGVVTRQYWNPVFGVRAAAKDGEQAEELRWLLQDTVRLQVRSDVPIGAHLSGGIDSSAVCCLAAAAVKGLRTFTARFPEGGIYDETAYARMVADHIGADYNEIVPRTESLVDVLGRLVYHLDEPTEGAATVGKYHVAKLVGEQVKVVLGGQGGDELFGGYDWYVKNLFTALCRGDRRAIGSRSATEFLWGTLRYHSWRRLARSLAKNVRNAGIGEIHCANWSRTNTAGLRRLMLVRDVEESVDPAARFMRAFREIDADSDADRMFKFDARYYLAALLGSEDKLSMAFSVESRVPLLDYRILEFAGRLGFATKTVPGRTKGVLRDAARGVVPERILQRSDKRGFPTPISAWLRNPKLRLFDQMVFNDNDFARRYLDLSQVRRVLSSRMHFGSAWEEMLWRLLMVSVWGHRFRVA